MVLTAKPNLRAGTRLRCRPIQPLSNICAFDCAALEPQRQPACFACRKAQAHMVVCDAGLRPPAPFEELGASMQDDLLT